MIIDADLATTNPDTLDQTVDVTVLNYGPAAKHNMPCAIYASSHAVLNMNSGVFEPSWQAQREGWALLRIKSGRGWLFRLLRNWVFHSHTCEGVGK